MRALTLWNLIVRLGLDGVNDIREFDRLLDEENWNVITNNVPVSLRCIKLYGETTNIADSVLVIPSKTYYYFSGALLTALPRAP
jgi:hypothetical protein